MERPDPRHHDSAWALLLGPGADLAALEPLLAAWIESRRRHRDLLGPELLEDLGELVEDRPAAGRLVLHAAWLPLEDLGLVRRFLDARPGWDLVLVGGDPGTTVARRLLERGRVRWFHEPLDLRQLESLLQPPRGAGAEDDEDFDDGFGAQDDDPIRAALDVELDEEELEAFRSPPDADGFEDVPFGEEFGDEPFADEADEAEEWEDEPWESEADFGADEDRVDPDFGGDDAGPAYDPLDDPLEAPAAASQRAERRRARLTAESEADARLASGVDDEPTGGAFDDPEAFDDEIERILSRPPAAPESHGRPAGGPRPTAEESPATAIADPAAAARRSDPFGALLADIEAHDPDSEREGATPVDGRDSANGGDPALAADEAGARTTSGPDASHDAAPAAPELARRPDPLAPAPYFKQQVADLADIALRIELSLEMTRERAMDGGDLPALEDLELEVRRLSQFTRTLGYLASPPTAGRVPVGLAKMVEEMLAEAGSDDRSPRYLWRTDGPLDVVCDKTLMHHALEAVLYLVHHCAGEAGTVRVEGNERAPGDEGSVQLTLRFPAARLDGLSPQDAMVPYALRALLPDLGPNALAAAAGILRGQQGELRLLEAGSDWIWRLRLPRAR